MSYPQCGKDTDYCGIPGETWCTLNHKLVEEEECKQCIHYKRSNMQPQKTDRDCLIACLSQIFHVPYDNIPKFYAIFPNNLEEATKEQCDQFDREYRAWVREQGYIIAWVREQGYTIWRMEARYNKEKHSVEVWDWPQREFVGLAILKKRERRCSHIVVFYKHADTVSIKDPKPNSDYDITEITEIEVFIKVDSILC